MFDTHTTDHKPQPDSVIIDAERLAEQAGKLLPRLGGAAFTANQIEKLEGVLSELKDTAVALYRVAMELESQETFGEEESYWTTFRFFCTPDRAGTVFSVDELWEHLAKSYDMSAETRATLDETIREWTEDIEADAVVKFNLKGVFEKNKGGFVFIPYGPWPATKVVPAAEQKPLTDPEEEIVAEKVVPRQTPEDIFANRFLEYIKKRLSSEGDLRQPDIKKSATQLNNILNPVTLQELIDTFVSNGSIYKYTRGGAALLSLTPKESLSKADQVEEQEAEDNLIRALNTDLAAEILQLLCGPKTQWQQRLTLGEIWKRIHPEEERAATPEEEKEIRDAGRIVSDRYGLLLTGEGKAGKNPKFTIGLVSQTAKNTVRAKIASDGIAGIKQLFDKEPKDEDL